MIEGVIFKSIITHKDKRGFFREAFKLQKLFKSKKIHQVSHSFIKKNIIKAWHLHKIQDQLNYLLQGKLRVYLFDTRKNSKTYKKYLCFDLNSAGKNFIYFFPSGVAHGYITKSKENHMIYATSGIYNSKEEYKIKLENKIIPNFFSRKTK